MADQLCPQEMRSVASRPRDLHHIANLTAPVEDHDLPCSVEPSTRARG
jgi:hypothetical protein